MKKIWLLNGPNLNCLGQREPSWYGNKSLRQIEDNLKQTAAQQNFKLVAKQTNAEFEMLQWLHLAQEEQVAFILINPAAWTHTSVALRDALLACAIPFIEIHLSNIYAREPFRHHSYLADIATGMITGLGPLGYELALCAAIEFLNKPDEIE